MTESFLHYLFDSKKLGNSFKTTQGQTIDIIKFGILNKSSGSDFLEAQIKSDNKIWVGHIEFHLNSSDWIKHTHQNDRAYENVVAYFVFNHDKEIFVNKFRLPVVELKQIVERHDFSDYEKSQYRKNWVPCSNLIGEVSNQIIHEEMAVRLDQRLERKSNQVMEIVEMNAGDQRKMLFKLLGSSFEGRVNAYGFDQLVEKIDFSMLAHLNYEQFKIQNLLHWLSGLHPDQVDSNSYVEKISKEFEYQQKLFQLEPMAGTEWKLYGMRPTAHPTIRIAQFACFIACLAQVPDFLSLDKGELNLNFAWKMNNF